MPASIVTQNAIRKRIFFILTGFFLAICIVIQTFKTFRQMSYAPEHSFVNLALLGMFCLIPVLFAWLGIQRVGLIVFTVLSIITSFLYAFVSGRGDFMLLIAFFLIILFFAFSMETKFQDEIVIRDIEIEKYSVEKNDLESAFQEKGKNISVFFEKYSAYYNLRRLADEFSTTLELSKLGDLIVSRTIEFIQKGNWCLLFLAMNDKDEISLIASRTTDSKQRVKKKLGDIFDFWVLRNRQHLIVSDTQKDFRFDLKKTALLDGVRSVILSPILHEGKVVGTLRINSDYPDSFNTDQLRLLDAISTLASSALSNALLYQKTEELAIRDSLTHLYVQRYFLERLREEHKRALLTHQPLSLLMCDLDHFKKVNDQYGHAIGDLVLIKAGEVFRKICEHGIIARYGGEEFVVLLPHYSKKEALQLAEKLRKTIASEKVEVRREIIHTTISIGVATIPDDSLDQEEFVKIADERLYRAKHAGRNQVC